MTSIANRTSPIGPPLYLLAVAVGCVGVALVLGLLGHGSPALSVGGWVLGGFATIGLVAVFTMSDSLRRTDAWYVQNSVAAPFRAAVVVLAVLVVALNAYQFADWLARR